MTKMGPSTAGLRQVLDAFLQQRLPEDAKVREVALILVLANQGFQADLCSRPCTIQTCDGGDDQKRTLHMFSMSCLRVRNNAGKTWYVDIHGNIGTPSIVQHHARQKTSLPYAIQRAESGRVQVWLNTHEASMAADMIIGALQAQQQAQVISGQSIDLDKGPGRACRRL